MSIGSQEPIERAPSDQSWNYLSNKINQVVLNYNSNNNANIHESTLIVLIIYIPYKKRLTFHAEKNSNN